MYNIYDVFEKERIDTALHKAVSENKLETVYELLTQGVDVNAENLFYNTPLHYAVKAENKEILELLLAVDGIDVNPVNDDDDTPLHLAVESNNLEIVKLFLKTDGVDVNALNYDGDTSLHIAVQLKNIEIVKLLLKTDDVKLNIINKCGNSLMHLAVLKGSSKILKLLLKAGADSTTKDEDDLTPFESSIFNYEVINYLRKECRVDVLKFLKLILTYKNIGFVDDFLSKFSSTTLENYPDFSSANINNAFLEHIAKLKSLGSDIKSAFSDKISRISSYNKHYKMCEQELEKAKKTKLRYCWITFYNLLTDHKSKLVKYAGNQDLIQDFEESVKKFPIYGSTMQKNVSKGIKWRKLWDGAAINLSYHLPIFNATHLIIKDVLDLLKKKDWKNLNKN